MTYQEQETLKEIIKTLKYKAKPRYNPSPDGSRERYYEGESNAYNDCADILEKFANTEKIWHPGSEKPAIYVDPTTGHKLNTFALCIIWYDGWIEELCKVTEDGKFESMTGAGTYEYDSDFFEFWAYTYDLIPYSLYEKHIGYKELCKEMHLDEDDEPKLFYIGGDPDKADKIREAFEKLGCEKVNAFSFTDSKRMFFTYKSENKFDKKLYLEAGNYWILNDILPQHPYYRKLII